MFLKYVSSCPEEMIERMRSIKSIIQLLWPCFFPVPRPIFSVLAEVDLNQGKQHQRWPQGTALMNVCIMKIDSSNLMSVSISVSGSKLDRTRIFRNYQKLEIPYQWRSTQWSFTTSCWWKAQLSERARGCGEIQVNEIRLSSADDGMGRTSTNFLATHGES